MLAHRLIQTNLLFWYRLTAYQGCPGKRSINGCSRSSCCCCYFNFDIHVNIVFFSNLINVVYCLSIDISLLILGFDATASSVTASSQRSVDSFTGCRWRRCARRGRRRTWAVCRRFWRSTTTQLECCYAVTNTPHRRTLPTSPPDLQPTARVTNHNNNNKQICIAP